MAKNDAPVKRYPWKTQFNAALFPRRKERSFRPSMTVPDLSLSIPEIIARSARGLSVEHMLRVPIYDSGTNTDSVDELDALALKNYIPDIMNMDPVDQQEYRDRLKARIELAKKRRQALLELAKRAAAKKAHQGTQFSAQPVENGDSSTTDDPDNNPISAKNPNGPARSGAGPRREPRSSERGK